MTSEVAFVEGDTPCVIKRCRDPRYLEWLSREHRVLLALADSSLPMPRVLCYAQVDKKEEGREAWLVMSRLEGRPLWNEILHANSQRRARLLQRVGALLKRLHATPVPIGLRSESPWVAPARPSRIVPAGAGSGTCLSAGLTWPRSLKRRTTE